MKNILHLFVVFLSKIFHVFSSFMHILAIFFYLDSNGDDGVYLANSIVQSKQTKKFRTASWLFGLRQMNQNRLVLVVFS